MLLLILAFLATWRLSRLLTTDYLFEFYRRWMKRWGEKTEYFAECPWCTSVWLAVPVIWLAVEFPDSKVLLVAYGALAASGVTGMLTTLEDHWSQPG